MLWTKTGDLRHGNVLMEDVYLSFGSLYIPKDTVLTQSMIERMSDVGIQGAYIYSLDDLDEDDYNAQESIQAFKNTYNNAKKGLINVSDRLKMGQRSVIGYINGIIDEIIDAVTKNKNILKNMNSMKSKDDYTFNHMVNVSILSALAAKWIGYEEERIKVFAIAGLLHDIGKLSMPLRILKKPSKLTATEFSVVKRHPIASYEICKTIPNLCPEVLSCVVAHHERINGSGYPFALIEDQIPYAAKIVAIMDSYDAITSDRPYKKSRTPFDAFKILKANSNVGYDAGILRIVITRLSDFLIGDMVRLNNGAVGKVVSIPIDKPDKPLVISGSTVYDLSKEDDYYITGLIDKIE